MVPDMAAARASLLRCGLETTPVSDMGSILFPGSEDPDGNTRVLQQIGRP